MQLEFKQGDTVVRVDGDVLEIFRTQGFSHRYVLAFLAVQVQPGLKGRLVVRMTSASADTPLYELQAKPRSAPGATLEEVIPIEDEPLYRQFFSQVAQLCGRSVMA
jgi:hypothetical protein